MDIVINPKCGTCKSYYKQTMIKSSGLPYRSCETCINRYYKNKNKNKKLEQTKILIPITEDKPSLPIEDEKERIKTISIVEDDIKLQEMLKMLMGKSSFK